MSNTRAGVLFILPTGVSSSAVRAEIWRYRAMTWIFLNWSFIVMLGRFAIPGYRVARWYALTGLSSLFGTFCPVATFGHEVLLRKQVSS